MTEPTIDHSCSYHCDRPDCIKAQRDELRDRLQRLDSQPGAVEPAKRYTETICGMYESDDGQYVLFSDYDSMQSALKLAQEERDAKFEQLQISEAHLKLAESINRRMVEMTFGLWKLLDDIDTLDDAAKENDEAFRDKCYHIQRKRFDILSGHEFDAMSAELLKEVEK